MDSKFIQDKLQKRFYLTHPYQTLNFYRCGYNESDVFMIHKSNMLVTEFEVKISINDFKADFKKTFKHWKMQNPLSGEHSYCPSYFYYSCPKNLINISLIPNYAGLIYVDEFGEIEIIKKAPLLHKNKITQKALLGVLENLTAFRIFGCQYMTYKNRKVTNPLQSGI